LIAIQCYRSLGGYWALVTTPSIRICRLDRGNRPLIRIRFYHMLHVSLECQLRVGRANDSAKLLARLILTDRSLLGYTDIGKRAFGGWASGFINVL